MHILDLHTKKEFPVTMNSNMTIKTNHLEFITVQRVGQMGLHVALLLYKWHTYFDRVERLGVATPYRFPPFKGKQT